jgi:hypothetical protein
MSTEKTNDTKDKTGCTDFGSTPKGFREMFEGMSRCCMGQESSFDCSAMMKGMMGTCCAPKPENTKGERRE